MRIKKHQQTIIMIVIVVFTMVGFGFWVKHKLVKTKVEENQKSAETVDIDLNPRPIEELFASEFSNIKNNEANPDPLKCNSKRILDDRERLRKTYNTTYSYLGRLKLEESCWRAYENDEYSFSFQDLNDSLFFSHEAKDSFTIYDHNNSKEEIFIKKLGSSKEYLDRRLKNFDDKFRHLVRVRHYKNQNNVSVYTLNFDEYDWYNKIEENKTIIDISLGNYFYVTSGHPNLLTKEVLSTIKGK